MEENQDIRDELRKYKITYAQLLKYIDNFSHVNRISEELAKPLSIERKKVYLLAIRKVVEEKKRLYDELYEGD